LTKAAGADATGNFKLITAPMWLSLSTADKQRPRHRRVLHAAHGSSDNTIEAEIVIVSPSSTTQRALLRLEDREGPEAGANSSGHLGKLIMTHIRRRVRRVRTIGM